MYDIYYCPKCKTEHGGYMGERAYQGLWTAHYEHAVRLPQCKICKVRTTSMEYHMRTHNEAIAK